MSVPNSSLPPTELPDKSAVEKLARLLRERFLNRTDSLAFKAPWDKPCRLDAGPVLDALIRAHLDSSAHPVRTCWRKKDGKSGYVEGRFRLGTYSPGTDGLTRFAVIDCDGGDHGHPLADPLDAALSLVARLKAASITAHLERSKSGAGWHVWIFFAAPISAAKVRRLLLALIPSDLLLADGTAANVRSNAGIELFPKQDAIKPDGFGNMVYLPWFHGAAPGCNQFHRVDEGGEVLPYLPDGFDLVTEADVDRGLAAMSPAPVAPKKETRRTHQAHQDGRPSVETLLRWARDRLREHGRNQTGFDIACQLRDNNYGKDEAVAVLKEYVNETPAGDHPYTLSEAMASLDQVYGQEAREPWTPRQHSEPSSRNGHVRANKPTPSSNGTVHHEQAAAIPAPAPRRYNGPICNYRIECKGEGEEKTTVKVGLSAAAITAQVSEATGDWPRRVGERLFAADEKQHVPIWLDATENVFGWLARQHQEEDTNILWSSGDGKLTKAEFVASLRLSAENYRGVESHPHYPPLKGFYYIHPPMKPQGGRALKALLDRFYPATNTDADLLKALFLTLVWGGACGQRPAFLLDAKEDDAQGGRGVGKSKAAFAAAHVLGGHIDVRPTENIDKLMTRLLSAAAIEKRVAILDNVKTLRFSWADLESLITTDTLSGRALYFGEGQRPNTLLWLITLNRASMSKDMAQRCIPIQLARPPLDPAWEEKTQALIDHTRWEIIGDLVEELKRRVSALKRFSRWSAWEQQVLAHVSDPARAQKAIEERQETIDDDQAEADLVRQGFVAELRRRGHNPDEEAVWIPTVVAAEIVNEATGEKYPRNRAGIYLGTLTIPELRRKKHGERGRGWEWRGEKSNPNDRPREIMDRSSLDRNPYLNE